MAVNEEPAWLGFLKQRVMIKTDVYIRVFFIIIIIPPVNLFSISISSLVYHFMFNKYRFSMFIYPADTIASGNQIPTQILTVAASCQPACDILSLPDVQIRLCLIQYATMCKKKTITTTSKNKKQTKQKQQQKRTKKTDISGILFVCIKICILIQRSTCKRIQLYTYKNTRKCRT